MDDSKRNKVFYGVEHASKDGHFESLARFVVLLESEIGTLVIVLFRNYQHLVRRDTHQHEEKGEGETGQDRSSLESLEAILTTRDKEGRGQCSFSECPEDTLRPVGSRESCRNIPTI
eukprot:CAMPEP_0178833006 /NCGR_PEP_ID=MMETSP0746-20121128/10300_1 /TAXON_ID=913974 /ORGANISM="Nitzschia punctata, Strain CCMP561" /LENGTH=116 /DNA_ID=CAMNT_0020495359 /DNA_START=147 /DNA_END=497 /DNA_ORIENTATION=+